VGDRLIRIGSRLFNLVHVTSIEPEDGGDGMDVHIVHGRVVRLRGEDAIEARTLVDSFPGVPGAPSREGGSLPLEVADDHGDHEGGEVNGMRGARP
jgi:hypothetical protein